MEIQSTFAWIALAAISLGAVFGGAMLFTAIRTYWKKLSIAWSAVWFAAIGAFLISSPKITEVAISYGGVDVKIAQVEQLQRQLADVSDERDRLLDRVKVAEAGKAEVRDAIVKAIAATKDANQQPFPTMKLNEATKELNDALELWR